MLYSQFTRFLVPLIITMVIQGLSQQVLNGGMARMPRATETLAAFALAWGITDFLLSPLSQVRQLGLVLAEDAPSLRRIRVFVLVCAGLLAGALAVVGATPVGGWVIGELHGVAAPLGRVVRFALLWLAPLPVAEGLLRLWSGLLMRQRRTEVVSAGTIAGIAASAVCVFALLPAPFVRARPILLPILVVYAGVVANLVVLGWGCRRWVTPALPSRPGQAGESRATAPVEVTFGYLARFFWPLALIMSIQGLSRPLINLFVARGADGEEALAVLGVVYTLAIIPYGWLNDLRSLAPAFSGVADSLRHIRRFAGACGLVAFALMLLLFATPMRQLILVDLIGLHPDLADQCRLPLILFAAFPLTVAPRGYLHGLALLRRRTRSLAPSAPARIATILASLILLPGLIPHGATRGVAALLAGFVVEALVLWWFVCGRRGGGAAVDGRL
ncbi:hypothetical protein ACFL6X_00410 [Candidatus Latescibacterota bacterium]